MQNVWKSDCLVPRWLLQVSENRPLQISDMNCISWTQIRCWVFRKLIGRRNTFCQKPRKKTWKAPVLKLWGLKRLLCLPPPRPLIADIFILPYQLLSFTQVEWSIKQKCFSREVRRWILYVGACGVLFTLFSFCSLHSIRTLFVSPLFLCFFLILAFVFLLSFSCTERWIVFFVYIYNLKNYFNKWMSLLRCQ